MLLATSGLLDDLHEYSPADMRWTDLSSSPPASGTPPCARGSHGLAAAEGRLYVFGGYSHQGVPAPAPMQPRTRPCTCEGWSAGVADLLA